MIKFKNLFRFNLTKKKHIERLNQVVSKQNNEIELLHQILDETPCHIYWKNTNNKYLGCNSSQAKELGLSDKEKIINKLKYTNYLHLKKAKLLTKGFT